MTGFLVLAAIIGLSDKRSRENYPMIVGAVCMAALIAVIGVL